ncbi:MAG TPA: ABC transporter permease [Pyrinomonadaceae bacterium]|jgi:ABC-2 type transport system permease protein|nr:ABC transporter permease [Pyrinomonadaceae bacterium]
MRRIIAQTRKELTQIVRDWRTMLLAIILPLILLMLLGSAISLSVTDMPIVVQDLDDSPSSRELIDAFRSSLTLRVISWPTNKQPEEALSSSTARAALIIPAHFERNLKRGVDSPVQLIVDAADANTARLTAGYASQIIAAHSGTTNVVQQPVRAAIRLWYNPDRSSKKFYGPGIFVLALSIFPPLLAALAMAKEEDQKTILQVYVSNIAAAEFLFGKVLAFMVVALGEAAVMLVLLFTYFGLGFAGDPTPFVVATILYAFCVASFGTMIGATISNQAAAMQAVALGGFLFVFLLSGLLYPIENIPSSIRWLSHLVWGRYYIEIVRDAFLQGGGWPAVWLKELIIGVIGTVFFSLAWLNKRRMQVRA